jgi:hypothetical protein
MIRSTRPFSSILSPARRVHPSQDGSTIDGLPNQLPVHGSVRPCRLVYLAAITFSPGTDASIPLVSLRRSNLTNEEANALHGKVHDLLRERFGAEIR